MRSKFSIKLYYDPAYVDMWPLSRLPETTPNNPTQPHRRPFPTCHGYQLGHHSSSARSYTSTLVAYSGRGLSTQLVLATTFARRLRRSRPAKDLRCRMTPLTWSTPSSSRQLALECFLEKVELPHGLGINLCMKKLAASQLLKHGFITRPGRGGHCE